MEDQFEAEEDAADTASAVPPLPAAGWNAGSEMLNDG